MDIKCPHCGTEYEVEKQDMYHYTTCDICGKGFVIGATTSLLASEVATSRNVRQVDVQPSKTSVPRTNPVSRSRPLAGIGKTAARPCNLQSKFNRSSLIVLLSALCVGLMTMLIFAFVVISGKGFDMSCQDHKNVANIDVVENAKKSAQSEQSEETAPLSDASISNVEEEQESLGQPALSRQIVDDDSDDVDTEYDVDTEDDDSEGNVQIAPDHSKDAPNRESAMDVVKRICAGKRLTYKEWERRLNREMGIYKLGESLKEELSRAGYWAFRIESTGMQINVGRTTDSATGFIREGLGGGFTYPTWLPEDDAAYIYKAFLKIDAEEAVLWKEAEVYCEAFKNSEFYITPEEEERIEQAERLEYTKPLFASLCFNARQYFYIQKKLDMSVLSAKITDRRWKSLSEAQTNENWLDMMNIIESEDGSKKFDKYPSKEKIASLYNKILDHNWNVEVKLKNTGIHSLNTGIDASEFRRIDSQVKRGATEKDILRQHADKETYRRYLQFKTALNKLNSEGIPYSVDLEVRILKVEKDGDIKNIHFWQANRPHRDEGGNTVEFKFSIGKGAFYLLVVDDDWYWKQGLSEPLRKKMAKYVNVRNAYYSEMIKLGKAVNEKKQYSKKEASTIRKEIIDKYVKQLLPAISDFMGKTVAVPPEFTRASNDVVKQVQHTGLHREEMEGVDEGDVATYELGTHGNRFEEYEKERLKMEKLHAMSDGEAMRPKTKSRKEKLRLKGPTSW